MAHRSKILPLAAGLGILLALPVFFMDWSTEAEYPKLEKAERIIRNMSSPRRLERSSFLLVYPEGKPSQFVSWMFSPFGAAEWPPSQEELNAMGADNMRISTFPKDVGVYSSLRPDATKQILVKADDSQGIIIIEGFLKPDEPPVLVKQWSFQLPGVPELPSSAGFDGGSSDFTPK